MNQTEKGAFEAEATADGLLMTVTILPGDVDAMDRLMFLGGMALVVIGGFMLADGGFTLAGGGSILAVDGIIQGSILMMGFGIFLLFISYFNRNKSRSGDVIRYLVSSANGVVTFANNGNEKTCDRAKIGRMWIKRTSKNGMLVGVDIEMYYDSLVTTVFDITEASTVLDCGEEILEKIVDYLNSDQQHDDVKLCLEHVPKLEHVDGAEKTDQRILSGYRPDYAAGTSEEARDVKVLRPAWIRWLLVSPVSIVMLIYFSGLSGWPVNLLVGTVVAPGIFVMAVMYSRSCSCRYDDVKSFFYWPLGAALSGWLFGNAIGFIAETAHVQIPETLILTALYLLMTCILYRRLGGCSCGSHPERS